MKFTNEVQDGILVVTIEGNLMGDTSGKELLDAISEHVNDSINLCAVDLSGVEYMNSNGIGVLINILTKMRNRNGEAVLINPSDQIKKLLIITKLNSIFDVVGTKEEAISQLKTK
jgi:anti-sigma B factor antagonist